MIADGVAAALAVGALVAALSLPLDPLGACLAGALLLALLADSAMRILGVAPGAPTARWACIAAIGATGAAVCVPDPTISVLLGGAALAAGWLAVVLDPASSRAGSRAAGLYVLACFAGDFGAVGALAWSEERPSLAAFGLLASAIVRLRLVPFQGMGANLDRLPGRAAVAACYAPTLVGVAHLARASVLPGQVGDEGTAISALVGTIGLVTAVSAFLTLPLVRRYRATVDATYAVDAAHLAAAVAVGGTVALSAGLLYFVSAFAARATLLLLADVASSSGQQRTRLPGGAALLPFVLAFGSLAGMPPSPGFIARWLLYLALIERGEWLIALVLALASSAAFAQMLRRAAKLTAPARRQATARHLLSALSVLWVPLGLFVVAPSALLGGPLARAAERLGAAQSWSLGADTLLSLAGVLGLLLAMAALGFGALVYAERDAGRLRRPLERWRAAGESAWGGPLRGLATGTTPLRWVRNSIDTIGLAAAVVSGPLEGRYTTAGTVAVVLLLLALALG